MTNDIAEICQLYKNTNMRFLSLFIVLTYFLLQAVCRPSQQAEGNDSEAREIEYEGDSDTSAINYINDDQDSPKDEVQPLNDNRGEVSQYSQIQEANDDIDLKSYDDKRTPHRRVEDNKFSECKTGKQTNEESDPNAHLEDNVGMSSNRQHLNIDRETFDADNNQRTKLLSLADRNNYKMQSESDLKQRHVNYPTAANEEGELLFKSSRTQTKSDTEEFNNEPLDSNGQREFNKEYFNAIHTENKHKRDEKRLENAHTVDRDRREAQIFSEKSQNNNILSPSEKESNAAVEDSETAIKKKIEKLSKHDLEDLLNSLSDDKKAILNKVIDDKDSLNKREITKKSGAVDENNYMDTGPGEFRNAQGGLSSESNVDSSASQNADSTDPSTQTESNDGSSTKTPENEKSSDNSNSNAELIDANAKQDKSSQNTNTNIDLRNEDPNSNLNPNSKDLPKTENKREAHINHLSNMEAANDNLKSEYELHAVNYKDPYMDLNLPCNDNENWSDVANDDSELPEMYNNAIKREVAEDDPISMNSLQDSFPNDNVDELNTDLAPLIRVKRTEPDHSDKKRDTNVLSNIKVPFFPDAENENLENDERSEFEDYGIFDRKSYLTKNEQFEESDKSIPNNLRRQQRRLKTNENLDSSNVKRISSKTDKMSLGSDTDSILTGIEGVDENLMYNSGVRNKREVVEHSKMCKNDASIIDNRKLLRSGRTVGPTDMNTVLENNMNTPSFKEDEALGSLAHYYFEGDLGRYKRIRQAEQTTASQDLLDTSNK